jgi:transposase
MRKAWFASFYLPADFVAGSEVHIRPAAISSPFYEARMVSGGHLSRDLRVSILHQLLGLGNSVDVAYANIFVGSDVEYKLDSFRKLARQIGRMSEEELQRYRDGPIPRTLTGRKRKYGPETCDALISLRVRHSTAKFAKLLTIFQEYYDATDVPSKSTLSRMLSASGITMKVRESRNMHADPAAQLNYLLEIAPVDPVNLIDVDETLCTADEFHQKYGWAPIGEPAIHYQIIIGGTAYSTIAAYSCAGFLCWSIYEGSVTAVEVIHFINTQLVHHIAGLSMVLVDNAAVHVTEPSRIALEDVTRGRYKFSPPYSPKLKPIELGFANIKRWIRDNEAEAVADPIAYINFAFTRYSPAGECAAAGKSRDTLGIHDALQTHIATSLMQRAGIGRGILRTTDSTRRSRRRRCRRPWTRTYRRRR